MNQQYIKKNKNNIVVAGGDKKKPVKRMSKGLLAVSQGVRENSSFIARDIFC